MTRESFVTRWRGRRDELARLGAHVDGAKLCDELLADVEAMLTSEDESLLGLHEAAARSGYSRDIWNGAKYYEEAIDQLFGYLTWRESFGIVISFAKVKNFTDVLSKAKETTTKHSRHVPDTLSEITATHFASYHLFPKDTKKRVEVHHLHFYLEPHEE